VVAFTVAVNAAGFAKSIWNGVEVQPFPSFTTMSYLPAFNPVALAVVETVSPPLVIK
jgi:hypothetical protein